MKKENKNLKLNGKKIKLFIFSIFVLFLIIMMILLPFYIEKVIGEEILEYIAILLMPLMIIPFIYYYIANSLRKKQIKKASNNDYETIKNFLYNELRNKTPSDDYQYISGCDYFYTVDDMCEEFLNGEKRLCIGKEEIIAYSNDSETLDDIKKLKLEAFNNEIKRIIEIIYKYYDNDGVWKKYEKEK